MRFEPAYIERFDNTTAEPASLCGGAVKIGAGSRIIKSKLLGPVYLNRNTQVGPDCTVGKYFGMNESCFVARATVGAYCSIGARTSINPFNHPTDWLSIHEFQYHPNSFDWVPEYSEIKRLERTPDMYEHVTIGNDVWMGHNVNVMPGVSVGDGAVIAAGAVVTKTVAPYAIVAGVPAKVIRLRFPEKTVERLLRARWWDLELAELSGLPFRDVERCVSMIEEIRSRKAR
jgi:acetyltransferase-like isoleucine patch superfamily enzyme